MNITPLGPRVLITPKEQEEQTAGGIYIPEGAEQEKKQGTVVATGTTEDGGDLPLEKGDTIVYGGYSNEEIEHEGEEYVIVNYEDVLAKLE